MKMQTVFLHFYRYGFLSEGTVFCIPPVSPPFSYIWLYGNIGISILLQFSGIRCVSLHVNRFTGVKRFLFFITIVTHAFFPYFTGLFFYFSLIFPCVFSVSML